MRPSLRHHLLRGALVAFLALDRWGWSLSFTINCLASKHPTYG
jgi:hypothetical protein